MAEENRKSDEPETSQATPGSGDDDSVGAGAGEGKAPSESASLSSDPASKEAAELESPSGDPVPEARRASPDPKRSSRARDGKQTPRRSPSTVPSERAINYPDLRTLVMLGSVFAVTMASWGAARFACNVHTPFNRPPGPQTTARLSETPKDAAIELYQRWKSLDFDGALELASGSVAQRIQNERDECAKGTGACEQRRKNQGEVLTSAVVLTQETDRAVAKVRSSIGANQVEKARVTLIREGPIWKATETQPDK